MDKKTYLKVYSESLTGFFFKRKINILKDNHFVFNPNGHCWERPVFSEKSIDTITANCIKHHIKVVVDVPEFRRSTNYRTTFFENNKGVFNKGVYFCAYCGHLKKKEHITVDHIYPINKVKKNTITRKMLQFIGINDINCAKNLAPACARCNSQKGSKTGGWVIRGLIGRHSLFWIIYWIIIAILILSLIIAVVTNSQNIHHIINSII